MYSKKVFDKEVLDTAGATISFLDDDSDNEDEIITDLEAECECNNNCNYSSECKHAYQYTVGEHKGLTIKITRTRFKRMKDKLYGSPFYEYRVDAKYKDDERVTIGMYYLEKFCLYTAPHVVTKYSSTKKIRNKNTL